jgi:taurine dioxygenase
MPLETRSLHPNVGIEIPGLVLGAERSEAERAELRALWLEHGLVLIHDPEVTPESQIAFSRGFGELEAHPLGKTVRSSEHEELLVLDNRDETQAYVSYYDGRPLAGRLFWHSDLIYTGAPNQGAVLRAVEIPEEDGLTGFVDQARAYDLLPEATKQRIKGLEVVYRWDVDMSRNRYVDRQGYEPGPKAPKKASDMNFPDFPDCAYPIVLVHPESGREILNISPMFLHHVVGLPEDESDALLHELVDHVTQPELAYYHRWKPDDVILWDNWRMMHSATGTAPGVKRIIHRTTILGGAKLGRIV